MDVRTFLLWITALALIAINIVGISLMAPAGKGGRAVDYTDLVSIILTAVAVILAALAIGVGLIAIWGYKQIVEHARSSAEAKAGEIAADRLESYLKSDVFKSLAKQAVKDIAAERGFRGLTGRDDGGTGSMEGGTDDDGGGEGGFEPRQP
ncbi:hypothetical protein [Niveispirillum fermenti]|uniref:hypothetical protein n=1 Tax=Niveispirillum fermenti TaxID=1233113 RepID=UPI003A844BA6